MVIQTPFAGETLGLLASNHPMSVRSGGGQSHWTFMRFSKPSLVAEIQRGGALLRRRDEWSVWLAENSNEMSKLWRRVYDKNEHLDEDTCCFSVEGPAGPEMRLLGFRLSPKDVRRVVIHAALLSLVVFFSGSSTRALRRRERQERHGLSGPEGNPKKLVGVRQGDPAQCFDDIASMHIEHIVVAMKA